MLIVPYGWDQPDNASRVQRLGVGLHVVRDDYSVATAAQALASVFADPRFSDCAAEVAPGLPPKMDWRPAARPLSPCFEDDGFSTGSSRPVEGVKLLIVFS